MAILPQKRALSVSKPMVDDLAGTLRVLSDPTRLAILALLKGGEFCVCELVAILGLPQNLVSHHLAILRRHRLIRDRRDARDGRWIYYSIAQDALAELDRECRELFDVSTIEDRVAECPEDSEPERPS